MSSIMPTIAPTPTEVSRPFWDACKEHRLIMQQCAACANYMFYPAYMCPHCGCSELRWEQVSGRGSIHSITTVHHPADPVFAQSTPYVVALIQLDEGPVMMSNIVGEDRLDSSIGDRVEVTFEETNGITLPRYQRVRT
jgi:uncharacterized OB-fold protein